MAALGHQSIVRALLDDDELGAQTTHWRLERLAAVDRNIIRLALYELIYLTDTPHAVVIDEAIEIAKRFGGEESGQFVNGVLDALKSRHEAGAERGESER